MLLVLDNYDSFTYNLVQYFAELGEEVVVRRNDAIDITGIEQLAPERLVISPGPCTPDEAGISLSAINHFAGVIPILGVCLGHQSIAQAFGGKIIRAKQLMHGKVSPISHDRRGIFANIGSPFIATRYHSLSVCQQSLPSCLTVTATASDGEIMGLQHCDLPIYGVQFHPESIETQFGHALLQNFLTISQTSG